MTPIDDRDTGSRLKWVPFTLAWDDAPLDLSFIFSDERPAGKHGFLGVVGDRMVFADGTVARFWGTCFNSGANFPTHEQSQVTARRLGKFGLNMVRTHQMDAEWSTPNIFEFNRAQPKGDTLSFDPRSMDRLDYLIYCLKQEGIYVYLDLLTYRQFLAGDGVESPEQLPPAAKPYAYFDPRLIELQKEFNRALWTHVNPYTELAYKDEPAIALTELQNESDFFSQPPVIEPYRSRLEILYGDWAARHRLQINADPVDFSKPDDQLALFMGEMQRDYYLEMIAHLREIGVRIPVAGTNWSKNLAVLESQRVTDFTDTHWYWNFPFWEGDLPPGLPPGFADQVPMVSQAKNGFVNGAFQRLLDRPLFVSEWDHAWPDEWRAESPLAYAAVASLQGWSGMTIHTYRYSSYGPVDRIGGGASTINGVTYRNHFDTFNDPAKFGLFYHAALMFRRGDVQRANQRIGIRVDEDMRGWRLAGPGNIPALAVHPEMHMTGMLLPGDGVEVTSVVDALASAVQHDAGEVRSDTGELWRSWEQGFGWIDTPRTKAAYGFLARVGRIDLDGFDLEISTDFAIVALSSLTDDTICDSASLLLTAVGRCDNTDARYDKERKHQLDPGHAPIVVEAIEGGVAIATNRRDLKVWVISDRGEAVSTVPSRLDNGKLHFAIGPQPAWNPSSIYYLIRP